MRIAIVYDCIFPETVGGAERWYTQLATRLSEEGHDVTYVTMTQWDEGEQPRHPFKVVAVAPRMELYSESGRRKIGPPLRFGWGVLMQMIKNGGRYDVVHSASFPYFSVIAAWLALLPRRRTKLAVDWVEVWSRAYWTDYLGPVGGRIGFAVQSFCTRLPDHNFALSKMHAARLPKGKEVTILTGLTGAYVDETRPEQPAPAKQPPTVVFAGRHIAEKNVTALPAALAVAHAKHPELRAEIYGRGPETDQMKRLIKEAGVEDFVDVPGFVSSERVSEAMSSAACMVLPSIREGYGLVVVESVSRGTPAVVVDGPDNAATELVDDGENGFLAKSASPEDLGAAIVRAIEGGDQLRSSTWDWYEQNRKRLSIETSIELVEAAYRQLSPERSE
jgi:glycosyltransferase involved in cell wall biosynthesis